MTSQCEQRRHRIRRFLQATLASTVAVSVLFGGGLVPAQATTSTTSAVSSHDAVQSSPLDQLPDVEPIQIGVADENGIAAPTDSSQMVQAETSTGEDVGIGLPVEDVEAETTTGGSAVYASAEDQVEITVQALDMDNKAGIDSGVRSLISIYSASSPESYEFPLDLPAGSTVEKTATGQVTVLDAQGKVAGVFDTPWAVDAKGKEVPTWFEVRNGSLVQHVKHAGAAYPVVADPVWLVPVIVAGARVAVKVVVKAETKKAAKKAAKKQVAKQTKKKVTSTKKPTKLKYRSHTKANLRHNLKVKTGKNPKHCQAHHTMPVKYQRDFKKAGINIHHPKHAEWWNSKKGLKNNHQSLARKYNNEWGKFFDKNKKPTKKQILNKRVQLHNKYKKYYRC